jgi:hypothetical protein
MSRTCERETIWAAIRLDSDRNSGTEELHVVLDFRMTEHGGVPVSHRIC